MPEIMRFGCRKAVQALWLRRLVFAQNEDFVFTEKIYKKGLQCRP
jgi:hypothetical protein